MALYVMATRRINVALVQTEIRRLLIIDVTCITCYIYILQGATNMILFKQMLILFLIMLVGFICRKKHILTNEGSRVISSIVVNVANPALILSASINKDSFVKGNELIFVAMLSIGVYVFLLIMSKIIVSILRVEKRNVGTMKVMTVFSNIGFMGFPLISAVYGSQALLYASFFLIPYNVLIYTWGISAMTDNNCESNVLGKKKIAWNKIFNVGVIACIITIIIYLSEIRVPDFIESTVTNISNLTAPLSMIVIGDSIALMDIKKLITDKKLLLFALIKQIAIPVIGVLIIKTMNISYEMIGVCLVMLATPVGSMTAMLAQQYDGDYEFASKGVALTTLMSVVTIPIVSFVLGM